MVSARLDSITMHPCCQHWILIFEKALICEKRPMVDQVQSSCFRILQAAAHGCRARSFRSALGLESHRADSPTRCFAASVLQVVQIGWNTINPTGSRRRHPVDNQGQNGKTIRVRGCPCLRWLASCHPCKKIPCRGHGAQIV